MAYIICDEHGGNVASLVSPQIAQQVLSNSIDKNGLMIIVSRDSEGKEYKNFVDAEFFKKAEIDFKLDLSKPIIFDDLALELYLELVPVCPVCLAIEIKKVKGGENKGNNE